MVESGRVGLPIYSISWILAVIKQCIIYTNATGKADDLAADFERTALMNVQNPVSIMDEMASLNQSNPNLGS